ncbi:uncharacterized protein [Centruroides vittatus]|uniref:uncharacterized protein n=1 Tax=Centruroides vittatus TaxID=120091 RepID=UPI00350EFC67
MLQIIISQTYSNRFVLLVVVILLLTVINGVISVTLMLDTVYQKAYEPRELLLKLSSFDIPEQTRLEINIFLERFEGPSIGFTCLDIFFITKGTLISMASIILTYLLMYLQFTQTRISMLLQ